MEYPHRLRVTRTPPGASQDPETGVPTAVEPDVLYDGRADVQDQVSSKELARGGRALEEAEATVWPESEDLAPKLRTGEHVEVTWEDGSTEDGEVVETRRLDNMVWIRYL